MSETIPNYRIQGATGDWEVVIGLEVHAQVTSKSKLFSGAATAFGAEPNSQVSLVDAAMPGMLPVLNRECIRQAVRTGLAIDAQINKYSRFDRKNYFYADLPQGYQISQLFHPIVGEGHIDVVPDDKRPDMTKRIGVERIHVEQDAGKLMHDQHPTMSYVDLNRSGVALMEIVSRPDMRSPAEAGAFLKKLRQILRNVGSCNGNMQEGSMRADVNVSVRKPGDEFGTRTETKNVNSIRFVMSVVEQEARRQVGVIEDGGKIIQETRLYDPDRNETRSMRSKEDAHDYRYFPDPDLLPLELSENFLAECKGSMPEGVDERELRYVMTLGLTLYQARELNKEVGWARFFDKVVENLSEIIVRPIQDLARAAANLVMNEIFGYLSGLGIHEGIDEKTGEPVGCLSTMQAAKLLKLRIDGTLSAPLYKELFGVIVSTPDDPEVVAREKGFVQTSDTGAIDAAVDAVLAANPDKVEQYRGGKEALFGFFVGQTMKAMQGKANPQLINAAIKAKLG